MPCIAMYEVGVEYFIGEVKRHPVLWDPKHSDFNNRHSKLTAWVDVATKMYDESENWSNYDKFGKVRELQKRWKNFRDSYMREVKYRKKVEKGMAQPKKKKYIYSDLLTFLSPGKPTKLQSSSEQSSTEEDESNVEMDHNYTPPETNQSVNRVKPVDEMDHNNCAPETNQSVSRVEAVYETDQNNMSCKVDTNKPETSYLEEYLKQQQYTYQNISEQSIPGRFHQAGGEQFPGYSLSGEQAELDDDKMFLLSLLPYFKKLEDPKKLQARITVTKLVHDLLYKTS